MRLTPYVGSLSPGRFADVVLLSDLASLKIEKVWADGTQVSEGKRYTEEVPRIDWPSWATNTINIRRKVTAKDFALPAEPGRATMKAAVIRPFHWHADFYTLDLPVRDGEVQRDPSENITKFAIVDRFSGEGRISKMFWRGCGPRTPETALACSVAHDKHNIWVVGSSDAAMATSRERAGRNPGRLGARARGRARGHRALRDRRAHDLPTGRGARRRDAAPLCRGRARSTGCTSRLSGHAGIRDFPSG